MASFVVLTAPASARTHAGHEGRETVFVRDGFHIVAFLVPWLWLLWHRLWIEALVAVAVAVLFAALGNVAGYSIAGSLLSVLVSIYVGLEGSAIELV